MDIKKVWITLLLLEGFCMSIWADATNLGNGVMTNTSETVIGDGIKIMEKFYQRYNSTKEVDIVFVLDHSSSVPATVWTSTMKFIEDILEHFTVDKENTRVAIITYGTTASVDINDLEPGMFTNKQNKCTLLRRLWTNVAKKLPHGYTATYDALERSYNIILNSRPSAKKAIVVVTDGKSNIGPPPVKMSFDILSLRWNQSWNETLYGPQLEIHAFGVEKAYVPELRSIASNLPHHVFMLPTFELFEEFALSLHGDLQEERWVPTSRATCGVSCNSPYSQCMCGSHVGQYACICQAGFEMVANECKACPKGYFKEGAEPVACTICPGNTTTSSVGATSSADCQPLPGFRECPPLPDILHGTKFYVTGTRRDEVFNTGVSCDEVHDGNSCHYECETGHRLNNSPVMVCNSTGEWEGEIPNCYVVDCHEVEKVSNELYGVTMHYVHNSTTLSSVVMVTCPSGQVALGNTTWACDADGRWTKPWNFQCAVVYCQPVPVVPFMIVRPANCASQKQLVGDGCGVSCLPGFQLQGPNVTTCVFDVNAHWQPHAEWTCADIENPKIECPKNIVVFVNNVGDNSTIIHYQAHPPTITDNSHEFGWEVTGAPEDNMFLVGNHFLVYTAKDANNNMDICTQSIQVKDKSFDIIYCPTDITVQSGPKHTQTAEWKPPVFARPDNTTVAATCDWASGREFTFGTTDVTCHPTGESRDVIECTFTVTVKNPECPLPFPDNPPTNGALICGTNDYFPKTCRIHCHDQHKLRIHKYDHRFNCGWDGKWHLPDVHGYWPSCFRSRGAQGVYTIHEVTVRYEGWCHENHEEISENFKDSIAKVLQSGYGPCHEGYTCDIKDVEVHCGSMSRRPPRAVAFEDYVTEFNADLIESQRSLRKRNRRETNLRMMRAERSTDEENEEFKITFTITAKMEDTTYNNLTMNMTEFEKAQATLASNLDQIYYEIDNMIYDGLNFTTGNGTGFVDSIDFGISDFNLTCNDGEEKIITLDDEGLLANAFCYECIAGTYSTNGSCVRCPRGSYQDMPGQTTCIMCPNGTNTVEPGASRAQQCITPCAAGWMSITGYEPCSPCPKGAYQTLSAQSSCEFCSNNTTTIAEAVSHNDSCVDITSCEVANMTCVKGICVFYNGTTECVCDVGYAGDQCNQTAQTSPCDYMTCLNNGTCQETQDHQAMCICDSKFTGARCESDVVTNVTTVPSCADSVCQNNGTCIDTLDNILCLCVRGFNGTWCETLVDPCQHDSCLHGNCSQVGEQYEFVCQCETGFAGSSCSKAVDVCSSVKCYNSGKCSAPAALSPHCVCPPAYSGEHCEKVVDYCTPNPCQHEAVCIAVRATEYFCVCPTGYAGPHCQTVVSANFDLVFSGTSIQDYVSTTVAHTLHAVTACVWVRSSDHHHYGTVLSYAAESNWLPGSDPGNTFTLYDLNSLQIFVNGEVAKTRLRLATGSWQHLCVSWDGGSGNWEVWVNGTRRSRGYGLAHGTHMEPHGVLVLGQEQDSVGGGFSVTESLIGEISQLNIYDSLLTEDRMQSLYNAGSSECALGDGNVLAWTAIHDKVHGQVLVRNGSMCRDVNECTYLETNECGSHQFCEDHKGSYSCNNCPTESTLPRCNNTMPSVCEHANCYHGATCQEMQHDTYRCICPPEYTGSRCQYPRVQCDNFVCNNNGTCVEDSQGGASCQCSISWRGRHCNVLYEPNCQDQPCLNNGTCTQDVAGRYHCACPDDGTLYGELCEVLTACDSQPCLNAATCVSRRADGYECVCAPGYTGSQCTSEIVPITSSPTTVETSVDPVTSSTTSLILQTTTKRITTETSDNPCVHNPCENGGSCQSKDKGRRFTCKCLEKYTGTYCRELKPTEIRKYLVTVTLLIKYKTSMKYNESFVEEFRQSIHRVYTEGKIFGKIQVDITSVRPGSAIVDFTMLHTVYLDHSTDGLHIMRSVMKTELIKNKLGSFSASLDNFKFQRANGTGPGTLIYTVIGILAGFFLLFITIGLILYCRRRSHSNPSKLNNDGQQQYPTRIDNPVFEPDSPPATPRMRWQQEADNIYAELGDGAMAGEGDLGERFPSKRGREINKEWAFNNRLHIPLPAKPDEKSCNLNRQSIPLPPKPDDPHQRPPSYMGATGYAPRAVPEDDYLVPCSGIPPPKYSETTDSNLCSHVASKRDNGKRDVPSDLPSSKGHKNPSDFDSMYLTFDDDTLSAKAHLEANQRHSAIENEYLTPIAAQASHMSSASADPSSTRSSTEYLNLGPDREPFPEPAEYLALQPSSPTSSELPNSPQSPFTPSSHGTDSDKQNLVDEPEVEEEGQVNVIYAIGGPMDEVEMIPTDDYV